MGLATFEVVQPVGSFEVGAILTEKDLAGIDVERLLSLGVITRLESGGQGNAEAAIDACVAEINALEEQLGEANRRIDELHKDVEVLTQRAAIGDRLKAIEEKLNLLLSGEPEEEIVVIDPEVQADQPVVVPDEVKPEAAPEAPAAEGKPKKP